MKGGLADGLFVIERSFAEGRIDDHGDLALADKVGDVFDGYITGVAPFGMFVELTEHYVEGLVHVGTMADDYYRFHEQAHALFGENTKKTYRLGDRVRIVVLKASVEDRKIDFRLVDDEGPAKPLPERGKPAKRVKQKY